MKIKTILTLTFLLLIFTDGAAQDLAIGEWQIHSSYNSCVNVIEHDKKLYVVCKYGMFTYDLESKSLSKLSKVDGLSDNNFSALGYNKRHGVIVIGYTNGDVDLLKDGIIYNISSIKRALNILGTKTINHIQEYGDFVFLSTDFGVVKIDVVNPSIKETYKNLTAAGDVLKVNQSLISTVDNQDSLFLATNVGIIVASLNSKNLIDYSEWTLIDSTNSEFTIEKEILGLTEIDGEIFAMTDFQNRLFRRDSSGWKRISSPIDPVDEAFSLFSKDGFLYASSKIFEDFAIADTDGNFLERKSDPIFSEPGYIFIDSKNNEYVVDFEAGFFREMDDGSFSYLNPNGPFRPDAFNIEYVNDEIFVLTGGYSGNILSPLFSNGGYNIYNYESGWETYSGLRWSPAAFDITDAAYHINRDETYLSSYSHGLVLINNQGEYTVIYDGTTVTTATTPFISPLTPSYIRARIPCVQTDRNGDVWFTNFFPANNDQIFRINEDGTWSGFKIANIAGEQISDIKFDLDNNIWALSRGGLAPSSILAISEEGDLKRLFSNSDLFNNPTCVEIDKVGDVWVGTEEGIVIIKNENKMTSFSLERPVIDGRYLLENLVVKGITVDGANRKWISTSDGVWVFNEDGTEEIHHFTRENSPLLSNDILDIAIHSNTGEVFIATAFGVASYRAESTESDDILCVDPIIVYPNPVPAGYAGFVGINGVPEDGLVKIADISGNLVYERNAYGGQAVWDTRDINGNKVKTGIYIAYISSTDTENTCVVKIAVVE